MNSKKITFASIIIVRIVTCDLVFSQEAENEIEQVIESSGELTDESFDYSEIGQTLNYLKEHPINLNAASKDQLEQLVFLTPLQINALITHREQNGAYLDLLELQNIDAIDPEALERLLPYVTLKRSTLLPDLSFKELVSMSEHDLMFRVGQVLEEQRGYHLPDSTTQSRYLGSSQRLFTRYRYHHQDKLAIGLTMEKDAGEAFFRGAQKNGFDFYSGFISFQGSSTFKQIIVGDYALKLGQGLTMWTGLGFGKGASVATIVKNDLGLRPYSSTNESLFLRGLAATVVFKWFSFTPFVSYRSLDGSLNSDQTRISSINESGFHRTISELENRNTVNQFIYGSAAAYEHKNLKIGTVFYHTRFNHPFDPGDAEYKKFTFSTSSLTNAGVYYNYNWRNLYFFGEASNSIKSGFAYLAGLLASLTKQVSFVAVYRNYEKDYYSFLSQALAESTNPINERAFYSGLVISPNSKVEISAYTDVFSFPWLKYRVDAPSKGYEVLTQLTYAPSKKLKFLVRYKLENKEENDDSGSQLNFLESVEKQSFRGELNYSINNSFQLRNRIEMVAYQKGSNSKEFGYLMYQDVVYKPMGTKFSGNLRFAIFDTDSFDSRIYAYERDVLYGYSVPGYQNRGTRFYLNGRYRIKRGLDLWVRYAITRYTNIEEIGSGLDIIEGNQKSDIKVQLRMQF